MPSESPTPLPPPPPQSGEDHRPSAEHGSEQRGGNDRGSNSSGGLPGNWPRWLIWVLLGLVAASFLAPLALPGSSSTGISYSEFLDRAEAEQIDKIDYDNTTAKISGEFTSGPDEGDKFTTTGVGLDGFSDADRETLEE
ncbi:MAG: ATP-dependent metallopeptidase FtsH/Yme1/Tma family protein, partial [Acidimicrobiales bacterium]